MELSINELITILIISLIPAILAFRLGKELSK